MKLLVLNSENQVLCTLSGDWKNNHIDGSWSAPVAQSGEAKYYELRSENDELVLRSKLNSPRTRGRKPRNAIRVPSVQLYEGSTFTLNYLEVK